jgi:hypothetical protein
MSFDAIEKKHNRCKADMPSESERYQFRDFGDSVEIMGNISCNSRWNHGERMPLSAARALFEMVEERRCAPGLIGPVAPPRIEGDAQRVMDGLLRECLKRKPLMP